MFSICQALQFIALLSTAICSAGILYTARNIFSTVQRASNQLLDFAAELLDLIDPVLPPAGGATTPQHPADVSATASPAASSHAALDGFFEGYPGWDADLSPASWSPPSPPPPEEEGEEEEAAMFPLDEELRTPPASPTQSETLLWSSEVTAACRPRRGSSARPARRRLSYPAARVPKKPNTAGLYPYQRPCMTAAPRVLCGRYARSHGDGSFGR
ncbi:hypothetical protein V2A60_008909 [Cordyceps javanica]